MMQSYHAKVISLGEINESVSRSGEEINPITNFAELNGSGSKYGVHFSSNNLRYRVWVST